jgi:Protein of unknown function (DUF3365)
MNHYLFKYMLIFAVAFPVSATAQENFLGESRSVAIALMQQLGAELKKEIAAGGPDAAIKVCTKIAPELATKLSIENGWRVTRVSLKTRNPLLGTADAWEQQALKDFDARAAAGDAADKLEFSEIVNEPNGRYFRYLKALPVQPLCLSCHGGTEQISESVKATLAQLYPHDRAIGYALGQVRGAISIKRLVPQ